MQLLSRNGLQTPLRALAGRSRSRRRAVAVGSRTVAMSRAEAGHGRG